MVSPRQLRKAMRAMIIRSQGWDPGPLTVSSVKGGPYEPSPLLDLLPKVSPPWGDVKPAPKKPRRLKAWLPQR